VTETIENEIDDQVWSQVRRVTLLSPNCCLGEGMRCFPDLMKEIDGLFLYFTQIVNALFESFRLEFWVTVGYPRIRKLRQNRSLSAARRSNRNIENLTYARFDDRIAMKSTVESWVPSVHMASVACSPVRGEKIWVG